jgi:hypothetical protein
LAISERFQRGGEIAKNVISVKEDLAIERQYACQSNRDPSKNAPAPSRPEGAKRIEAGISVMLKTFYAVGAAAIIAAAFVTALSVADVVDARGSAPDAKTDRADARPLAGDCSRNSWPYFEASCLRDVRNPFGQAREVRLVSTDRLTANAAH